MKHRTITMSEALELIEQPSTIKDAVFYNMTLPGVEAKAPAVHNCIFDKVNLDGINCTETIFRECEFLSGSWRNSDLSRARFLNCRFDGFVFYGTELTTTLFMDCQFDARRFVYCETRGADFSGSSMPGSIEYIEKNFEKDEHGIIVYKIFGLHYPADKRWVIKPGSIIESAVNGNQDILCGCGINVATFEWVLRHAAKTGKAIWKCRIRWPWLAGTVIPYNTDGKIRTERLELIKPMRYHEALEEK